jgi:Uma2 family endonuclease
MNPGVCKDMGKAMATEAEHELADELAQEIWFGLRMSADEFMALPESKYRYELIDGVVFLPPEVDHETWAGLRMTAEEFLALPESPGHYELINGVVLMSPNPDLVHQDLLAELLAQFKTFLKAHPTGWVFPEVDFNVGAAAGVEDTIYQPDLVYVTRESMPKRTRRLGCTPAIVVEILSPRTRNLDCRTKLEDYERAGVAEYWLIDPRAAAFEFYRLSDGRYAKIESQDQSYSTPVVPGFLLDLESLRQVCEGE